MVSASARKLSKELRTAAHAQRDTMTIQIAKNVLVSQEELKKIPTQGCQSVSLRMIQEVTFNVPAWRTTVELSVTNVLQDTTTFQTVSHVIVMTRHPKVMCVTL